MLLWWWMLAAAVIVFAGAVAMLVIAYVRRGTPGLPIFGEREGVSEGLVLVFGLAIPAVVLVALFGVAERIPDPADLAAAAFKHRADDPGGRPSVVVGGPLRGRPARSPPTRSTCRSASR